MLSIQNLTKIFHEGTVNENCLFQDFSLDVEEGDFISIIGSNGSGKTSLLNIICGSMPIEGGTITLRGEDITNKQEHRRYAKIGRVFQDPSMGTAPSMTLIQNLSLADNKNASYNLARGTNAARTNDYRQMLQRLGLGLEDKLENKVESFSGGQRQAVALLMATMTPIDFLALDEHTAALDPKTARVIMSLTANLVKEKKLTTLMVTHNLKQAIEYGNRLIMIHEGKIVLDLRGKEKENAHTDDLLEIFNKISMERGNSV